VKRYVTIGTLQRKFKILTLTVQEFNKRIVCIYSVTNNYLCRFISSTKKKMEQFYLIFLLNNVGTGKPFREFWGTRYSIFKKIIIMVYL
jgi:hypothetical protein